MKKIINELLGKKYKPLAGNNRSFSNRATRRKFNTNRQKFQVNSQNCYIPVKSFRAYWAKLRKIS